MLNGVPEAINSATRLITLNHPNAMDGVAFRKQVLRTAGNSLGGLPTVGGMGSLDSEDESDYEYQELGDIRIVFAGIFQGEGNNWMDAETGINYPAMPIEALIECVANPTDPDAFVVKKSDRISVEPGGGTVLIYEVIGVTGNVNIPPYTRKFVLAARSDSEVGIG